MSQEPPVSESPLLSPIELGALSLSNRIVTSSTGFGAALARFDPKTLYTPGEAGYTDYPSDAA